MEERTIALLGVFSKKYHAPSPLSLANLAQRAGVSVGQLRPKYPRSPEACLRIAGACGEAMAEAGLIEKNRASEIKGWVVRGENPEIEDLIGRLVSGFRCKDCGEVFDESMFLRPHYRCFPCYNAHRSPATKEWLAAVDKLIGRAPEHIQAAWRAGKQGRKAVSYKGMAAAAKMPEAQFQADWRAAGLPERPAGRPRTQNLPRTPRDGRIQRNPLFCGIS